MNKVFLFFVFCFFPGQSRVCQLAWQPFSESQAECENLSALFDQEISFRA